MGNHQIPLVTVIIPTANRPMYLPRAVDSALAGMDEGDVEVVVVPNGADESWRRSLQQYQKNPSVRVTRIIEPNANVARNAGLAEARGEYVRFLDDDDFLIPEGAKKQIDMLESAGADLVSGAVKLLNEKGRCIGVWYQPATKDFCSAVIGPWRRCIPAAHVFRRSTLKNIEWNPKTAIRQDVEWMLNLCASNELNWFSTHEIVGVWQHHWGVRISSSKNFNKIRQLTVPMIMKCFKQLKTDGRLNDERRRAVALGLWGCVQTAFFLKPSYWHRVAKLAQRIDPKARPEQMLYHLPILKSLDPLTIQILMLPKRLLFHLGRQWLKKQSIMHNW